MDIALNENLSPVFMVDNIVVEILSPFEIGKPVLRVGFILSYGNSVEDC